MTEMKIDLDLPTTYYEEYPRRDLLLHAFPDEIGYIPSHLFHAIRKLYRLINNVSFTRAKWYKKVEQVIEEALDHIYEEWESAPHTSYDEEELDRDIIDGLYCLVYDLGFDKYPRSWYQSEYEKTKSAKVFIDIIGASLAYYTGSLKLRRDYVTYWLMGNNLKEPPVYVTNQAPTVSDLPYDLSEQVSAFSLASQAISLGLDFAQGRKIGIEGSPLSKALMKQQSENNPQIEGGTTNMKSINVQFTQGGTVYEYLVPSYLEKYLVKELTDSTKLVAITPKAATRPFSDSYIASAQVVSINEVASKKATTMILGLVDVTDSAERNRAIADKLKEKQKLLKQAQERYENANKLALYAKAAESDPEMKALLDQIEGIEL